MLSQMHQSSKRYAKMNKYKTKLGGSGFQFLLQSMDRDKENHVPNALPIHYGHLTQSVSIDSQPTIPASYVNPSLYASKPQNIYLDNVKILDCSDQSISEMSEANCSKKCAKMMSYNRLQRQQSKILKKSMKQSCISSKFIDISQITTVVEKEGRKKVSKYQLDQLFEKVKKYLMLSHEMLQGGKPEIMVKAKSKLRSYYKSICSLMKALEDDETQDCRSILQNRSNSNMIGSYFEKDRQSQEYLKKISRLQDEKEKLNNLISKHELANIKMFIKINEGESEEIEQCKKQLNLLFCKYKQLEKLIKKDRLQIIQITKEKKETKEKYEQVCLANKELKKILQMQPKKGSKQSPSYIVCPDVQNLCLKASKRQKSRQRQYQNSASERGELRIESLKNSRCYEEPQSSAITITSRMNVQNGGALGINLNALVESIKQQNFKTLMQQPQQLKRVIEQCRKTIISLQNIISQQNKELQLSITALEESHGKIESNQIKIKELQKKLFDLECMMKREKLKNVQAQSIKIERQRSKGAKLNRPGRKGSEDLDSKSSLQEQRIKPYEGKQIGIINFESNLRYLDEYRIIATQAQALEKFIKGKERR